MMSIFMRLYGKHQYNATIIGLIQVGKIYEHIRRMKLNKLKISSTNRVTYEGEEDESEDEDVSFNLRVMTVMLNVCCDCITIC